MGSVEKRLERLEETEEARQRKRESHAAYLRARDPRRPGREWANGGAWLAEYSRRREALWG